MGFMNKYSSQPSSILLLYQSAEKRRLLIHAYSPEETERHSKGIGIDRFAFETYGFCSPTSLLLLDTNSTSSRLIARPLLTPFFVTYANAYRRGDPAFSRRCVRKPRGRDKLREISPVNFRRRSCTARHSEELIVSEN